MPRGRLVSWGPAWFHWVSGIGIGHEREKQELHSDIGTGKHTIEQNT